MQNECSYSQEVLRLQRPEISNKTKCRYCTIFENVHEIVENFGNSDKSNTDMFHHPELTRSNSDIWQPFFLIIHNVLIFFNNYSIILDFFIRQYSVPFSTHTRATTQWVIDNYSKSIAQERDTALPDTHREIKTLITPKDLSRSPEGTLSFATPSDKNKCPRKVRSNWIIETGGGLQKVFLSVHLIIDNGEGRVNAQIPCRKH